MARPLRIEYPSAWYHVVNRGRRGEQVFECKDDYELFIEILQEAIELFALRLKKGSILVSTGGSIQFSAKGRCGDRGRKSPGYSLRKMFCVKGYPPNSWICHSIAEKPKADLTPLRLQDLCPSGDRLVHSHGC
jgi:cobalamin biosynthesis Co2+ chelatase CbiK